MGAGRKTQSYTYDSAANGKIPPEYKDLPADDLGGVIFGCTQYTYQECIKDLIFGLPYNHIKYVENIVDGMPIFLFNYTDRKLHGIFEADGHGDLNISLTAWCKGSKNVKTPYPAQVRVRVRDKCSAIPESAWKVVLKDNYYTETHFMFELTHTQAAMISSLFTCHGRTGASSSRLSSASARASSSTAPSYPPVLNAWQNLQNSWQTQNAVPVGPPRPPTVVATSASTSQPALVAWKVQVPASVSSTQEASVEVGSDGSSSSATTASWGNAGAKAGAKSEKGVNNGVPSFAKVASAGMDQQSNTNLEYAELQAKAAAKQKKLDDEERQMKELVALEKMHRLQAEAQKAQQCQQLQQQQPQAPQQQLQPQKNKQQLVQQQAVQHQVQNHQRQPQLQEQYQEREKQLPQVQLQQEDQAHKDKQETGQSTARVSNRNLLAVGDGVSNESSQRQQTDSRPGTAPPLASWIDASHLSSDFDRRLNLSAPGNQSNGAQGTTDNGVAEAPAWGTALVQVAVTPRRDVQLAQAAGPQHQGQANGQGLHPTQSEERPKVDLNSSAYLAMTPEQRVAALEAEVRSCHKLEAKTGVVLARMTHALNQLAAQQGWEVFNQQQPRVGGGIAALEYFNSQLNLLGIPSYETDIYLMGGFNSTSWLRSVQVFRPSQNEWREVAEMSEPRSYAASAVVGNRIYVFGGGDGKLWYNSVEMYDTSTNEWRSCRSLSFARGSLGGAAVGGHVYALGGGDVSSKFAEVEVYDQERDEWFMAAPLANRRFCVAAVELNNALYALGGFDGQQYLYTMERMDPREGAWRQAGRMTGRRGSLSAAVLQGQMYALGGFDGNHFLKSVEMYDPRMDTWQEAPAVSCPRAYAGAAVADSSLYFLGGLDGTVHIDSIERYTAGKGWEVVVHAASTGAQMRSFLAVAAL